MKASEHLDIEKFVNTSLVEIVANKIRSNIYKGKYEPGQRLIVRELADELGVSHTPIKDALNRLVAEGYIEAIPRKSMIVKQYTPHDFIENLEVRLMCELFCVDIILDDQILANNNFVEQMKNDVEALKTTLDKDGNIDYERWVLYQKLFHERYMGLLDNQKIVKIYKELEPHRNSYFTYQQNKGTPWTKERLRIDIKEHEDIIAAIEKKDKNELTSAIANHIFSVCSLIAKDKYAIEKMEKIRKRTGITSC